MSAAEPDDLNTLDDEDFRIHVRRWVEANYPAELRNPPKRLHWRDNKVWYMILAEKGWLAPGWPRDLGGMGLSAAKQLLMMEEFERHGVARTNDHGIVMLGPLLIRYGTQAQKDFFLPRILTGEHVWCQGYSEPNAGSDLASLTTSAVLEGEHWVINGQKTWTTLANDANWIFVLVRTDKTAKKQEGISFLLVPLDAPGVTIRPIVNLDMHDEFCEVFFDTVRTPKDYLIGEVNQGWTMAKALLGFERVMIGSPKQSAYALTRLRLLAQRMGVWEDGAFRDRYVRLRLDLADHTSLYRTYVEILRRGDLLGADVSMLKLHQSELYQRITETMLEIAGENAGLLEPMEGNRDLNPAGLFIQARPTTIYGGSNEIQRTILAKSVLGLPG
ncbi:MAG TPA: acyl-CoA dehydrogenase family protein [Stellaceae bacterium]|nr:acyl-CoA dehydrogenase family protein [Stellaceae bacterium]